MVEALLRIWDCCTVSASGVAGAESGDHAAGANAERGARRAGANAEGRTRRTSSVFFDQAGKQVSIRFHPLVQGLRKRGRKRPTGGRLEQALHIAQHNFGASRPDDILPDAGEEHRKVAGSGFWKTLNPRCCLEVSFFVFDHVFFRRMLIILR